MLPYLWQDKCTFRWRVFIIFFRTFWTPSFKLRVCDQVFALKWIKNPHQRVSKIEKSTVSNIQLLTEHCLLNIDH